MTESDEGGKGWKRTARGAALGAVSGAAGMAGFLWLGGEGQLIAMGGSRVALAGVALVYLITGAAILVGLASPRAGAGFLNVADADELVERRSPFLFSSVLTMGCGLALLLLALARAPDFPEGPVPAAVAVGAILLLVVGGTWISWRLRGMFDELDYQLGLEGTAWAWTLGWILFVLWAVGEILGIMPPLSAIDAVTASSAVLLLGSFIAIGKRGMLIR